MKGLDNDHPALVRRRQVFYIHGFDPRGPAPYHRMFVESAAAQAKVDGAEIRVGARRRPDPGCAEWTIEALFDGQAVTTHYTFLRWDDLARALWTRGEGRLFRAFLGWFGELIAAGFIGRARRRARPGFLAVLTPPLAVALFLAALSLTAGLAGAAGLRLAPLAGLPAWAGGALATLPFIAAPWGWKLVDRTFSLSWLSRCFSFICDASQGRIPELDRRAALFGDRILKAAREGGWDEILVVGHSQGACVAAMALVRALGRDPGLGEKAQVSLLTLGQPIAVWTQLPGSSWFRDELEVLAKAKSIAWLDVTSPSDGASACGVGPLDGLAADTPERPRRRSPRFHLILRPETFRFIRRRPFDYHFQYLRDSQVPRAYDYFRLTCGPESLRAFDQGWTDLVQETE